MSAVLETRRDSPRCGRRGNKRAQLDRLIGTLALGAPGSLVGNSLSIRKVPVKADPVTCSASNETGRGLYLHRAVRLSQVSIAWSLTSGTCAVVAGIAVGALSLAGYGLDA